MMEMLGASGVFSKAVTFVEFRQSGNPHEKYKAGRGILSKFNQEASRTGAYVPYIDQVLSETTDRFTELAKEIDAYCSATFGLSLEHSNPEAYRNMRLLEQLEED
jgi:hypothetical protein